MDMSKFSEPDGTNQSIQTLSALYSPDSFPGSASKYNTDQELEARRPHESLLLALPYLPVFELLVMSEVCKTLRDAVKRDVLPWLSITVERPLNWRLCDEMLMEITSRSNGRLKDLILLNCAKITDDGLHGVIEKNPFISKLHVPACTALTPDGIIRAVKSLCGLSNSIKSLRISGIYNIKKEHLEILRSCLQINPTHQKPQPLLYHNYRTIISSRNKETTAKIDVDICPKCEEIRMVFDCPKESCMKKNESLGSCRGCIFCISRCEECGVCVNTGETEDTLCSDFLCSNCWLYLPKCSFCNKPYRLRHALWWSSSPGSASFVCEVCHGKVEHSNQDGHFGPESD